MSGVLDWAKSSGPELRKCRLDQGSLDLGRENLEGRGEWGDGEQSGWEAWSFPLGPEVLAKFTSRR